MSQPMQRAAGFTLVELVMVISLIAIISVVAIPNFLDFGDDARDAVTRDEMAALKRAIVGDGRVVSGNTFAYAGFEADTGVLPVTLADLVTQPVAIATYNPLLRRGWRGPYVDDDAKSDYTKDAWSTAYVFTTSPRLIRSWGPNGADNTGGGDDIDLNF